ncbi:MAG: radical SAM protein [archaeon]
MERKAAARGTKSRALKGRKPRLLLVNPPHTLYRNSPIFSVYVPTGLLGLAANVRDLCGEISVLDCLIENPIPRKNPDGSVSCGLGFPEIARRLSEFAPDFVGIASPFASQAGNAREIAGICRKVCPGAEIIFGGPDASTRFREYLGKGVADYCVVGEGEFILRDFFRGLSKVKGLAVRKGGKILLTPRKFERNLDKLPLPAYDLVDLGKYLSNPRLYSGRGLIPERSVPIVTSRGCPYKCTFCSIHLHMGRRFRAHSPEYVVRHIRLLYEKYGVRNFHFEDDGLSLDRKRFEKILDLLIKSGMRIKWDAPNGVRADSLDRKLIGKMKKSGCFQVKIGIESGNQRILDGVVRKNLSLGKVVSVAKECKEAGLNCAAFYVIGFPGETIRNMEETSEFALRLLRECDVFPHLFIATPIYGTELHRLCVEKGYVSEVTERALAESTVSWGENVIETGEFSKRDVRQVLERFYRKALPEFIGYFIRKPGLLARAGKLALLNGSTLFFLGKYFSFRKGA